MSSTYLNQAGTSWPKPAPVLAAAQASLAVAPEDWTAQLEADHAAVAAELGTTPDRCLLTPGCTSALAVGVADLPWRAGDRALLAGLAHVALERPAAALAARGVEVSVIPPRAGPPFAPIDLERVEEALSAGRVRALLVPSADNVTGALFPLERLRTLTRAHGALLVVDAAQTVGWGPLPTADRVAVGGHKGTQGLWGVGALIDAPGLVTTSPRIDGGTPGPGWCDVGSVDRPALAALRAGLTWLEGQPERVALARGRIRRLQDGLCASAEVAGPADPEARVPTVAVRVPGVPSRLLAARLAERGVVAAGGLQCAPLAHRVLGTVSEGLLRWSIGPATDDAAIDRALEAWARIRA